MSSVWEFVPETRHSQQRDPSMMTRPQNDYTGYYYNDFESSQSTRVLPTKWAWKEERKSFNAPSSQYDDHANSYEYRDLGSRYSSRRPSLDSYYNDPSSQPLHPSNSHSSTITSSSSSSNLQPQLDQALESDLGRMEIGTALVEQESADPVSNTKQPLRRSTRQPGLIKNPYIVKEAHALKVARNRVYALIDASDEASRIVALSKAQKPSLAESLLMKEQSPSRLALKRTGSASSLTVKKRKRGEGGHDQDVERYELAYGYGEKDGEGIELEKELEKEQREFETRLWVEGPASTGAVVAYMRAKKRLLEVVALVSQWEEIKAQRIANGEDVGEVIVAVEAAATAAAAAIAELPPPPTVTQIRRSARNRNTATPSADGTASARPSPRLTRSRLQNERQQSSGPIATESQSSRRQAHSVSPTKTAVPPTSESVSGPSTQRRRSVSTGSDSTNESQNIVEEQITISHSEETPLTISPRKGRSAKRRKKVEKTETATTQAEDEDLGGAGNEDSATEGRTLRSRNKISLPSRFGDYVPNRP